MPTYIFYSLSGIPSPLISEKTGFLECDLLSMEQLELKLKPIVLLSSPSSLGELKLIIYETRIRHFNGPIVPHAFPQ